jgi:hypothetical protein
VGDEPEIAGKSVTDLLGQLFTRLAGPA